MGLYVIKENYKKLFWINPNWRLRNQILCAQFTLFFFTSVFIIGVIYINQNLLIKSMKVSSGQIFSKETQAQLINLDIIKEGLEYTIEFTISQIEVVNQFQNLASNAKNLSVQPAKECLFKAEDSYVREASICYGYFVGSYSDLDGQNQKDIDLMKKTISLMSSFYQLANYRLTQMAFASKHSVQFLAVMNYVELPTTYFPHERSWYKNHLSNKHLKSYTQNPPLQSYPSDIKVLISGNLTRSGNDFLGIIAKDINLNQELMRSQLQNTTVYLFDDDGFVVFGSQYLTNQSFFYLFEESVTGFDYADWLAIRNYTTSGVLQNEFCDDLIIDRVLCRYNSLNKNFIYIYITEVRGFRYKMLIFKDTLDFKISEMNQLSLLSQRFNNLQITQYVATIIVIFIVLLCSQFIIYLIVNQMNNLIDETLFSIKPRVKKGWLALYSPKSCTVITSQTVTKLIYSVQRVFWKLFYEHSYKNEQCIDIENIEYPSAARYQKKFAKKLFLHIRKSLINSTPVKSQNQNDSVQIRCKLGTIQVEYIFR